MSSSRRSNEFWGSEACRWLSSTIIFSVSSSNISTLVSSTAHSRAIMLYLVGLGLADETDVTVKGLEVVKRVERVYLEAYTSILLVDPAKLVCPRELPSQHRQNPSKQES